MTETALGLLSTGISEDKIEQYSAKIADRGAGHVYWYALRDPILEGLDWSGNVYDAGNRKALEMMRSPCEEWQGAGRKGYGKSDWRQALQSASADLHAAPWAH